MIKTKLFAASVLSLTMSMAYAEASLNQGALKLYIDKTDAQPRCPGCITVTLRVDLDAPLGSTVVSEIQSRIVSSAANEKIAAFVEFKEVSRGRSAAIYKGHVNVPSLLAKETENLSLIVEGFARACMNPTQVDCNFLAVKDELRAKISDVLTLER